ncbi:rod shape-determining protein MreD [Arachidicoccus ginsenosidimutans]|uniref:rod shape-determining protein MreD n=1 Tax=Arachidicoccus sp. BS20 TaxID=1850526 RepID=UPI0007F10DB9|nr:rod shape-determining protein MreD [Arachidicoccus sp. BS20]ANI89908.1 rod shape-determining protein MreD [Arachidicoccus sp. BS20]
MSVLLKNIFRFIFFILIQVFVLDKVPLIHQYIKPSLSFLFILWLPFSLSRASLMIIAFLFGLALDYFGGTPGLHSAPCVLIAYLRPLILNLILPQEKTEVSYIDPNARSIGIAPYAVYVIVLTVVYHIYLTFIEWMQFGNFLFFIGKVLASSLLSILLIFVTEILFFRKAKFKTNAA